MTVDFPSSKAAIEQIEFDWQIGHMRPWLFLTEIAAALRCTPEHVSTLIDDSSLDVAIDIKGDDAERPAYRVLRDSFSRFTRCEPDPTDFEMALQGYFKALPIVLSAEQAAQHLRCTDTHILSLSDHFTDIAAVDSGRRCLRIHRSQLYGFILRRKL